MKATLHKIDEYSYELCVDDEHITTLAEDELINDPSLFDTDKEKVLEILQAKGRVNLLVNFKLQGE